MPPWNTRLNCFVCILPPNIILIYLLPDCLIFFCPNSQKETEQAWPSARRCTQASACPRFRKGQKLGPFHKRKKGHMVKQLAPDLNRVTAEWWFKPDHHTGPQKAMRDRERGLFFKLKDKGFKCLFEILMGIVFMMNCLNFWWTTKQKNSLVCEFQCHLKELYR